MSVSLNTPQAPPRTGGRERGFGRLTRLFLNHRKLVGLAWLALTIVGFALVGPIAGRLSSSTALPGLPSYQAGLAIVHAYGNGGNNNPTVAVVTLPAGERVESRTGSAEVAATFAALDADRSLRVLSYPSVHDPRLVSDDGRAALGFVFGGADAPSSARLAAQMRSRASAGATVAATSLAGLYDAPSSGGIGVLGEVVIGGLSGRWWSSCSSSARSSPSSP